LVEKPEEKRPLRRPRHRWEDNGMDPKEIVWEVVAWMHLGQDKGPVAGCYEHANGHSGCIKCGKFLDLVTVSF